MSIDNVMNIMFVIFSTLMGIVIGSFLNVIIYRIPEGRTVVKGHSMCMTCGHELSALDLVPVFSWLFLGGKCRYCKAPISSRYIKIETFTGLIFFLFSITHTSFQLSIYDPMDPLRLVAFVHYCAILLIFAALISSMMIYHDTGKHYTGFSIFVGICIVIAYVLRLLVYSFSSIGPLMLTNIIFAVAYMAILAVLCIVFRKGYSKSDFWLDLPFAIFIAFFGKIFVTDLILLSICAFVLGVCPRLFAKKTKFDKFSLVLPTCGLALITVLGFVFNYFGINLM